MSQRYFITGTDTGVGKTVLSAMLCAALDASYWKPIQTGTEVDSDSRSVAELVGLAPEKILPEAYQFAPAVSPHLAARLAGVRIDLAKIKLPASDAPLIVEGAGGVLVPINERELMTDLMRLLGLPVLLAARSSLGTINHTTLSLAALRNAGVEVAGVVMIGAPNVENRAAIEEYGKVRVMGEIPWLTEINRGVLLEIFSARIDQSVFAPLVRATAQSS
jgi:dethiobiotin synthase|nr:dethiobiotin synthase [Candidatus Acidoferrales bacterium]